MGRGVRAAIQRHVRLRHLGPPAPQARAGPRPLRHQAALLVVPQRDPDLRLRDQGDPRASRRHAARLRDALNEYLTFQNIFSDQTMFEGIKLLPPATLLTFDLNTTTPPATRTYWDYPFP